MTQTTSVQLLVMGERVRFEGLRDAELAEVFEWFAGAVEVETSERSAPAMTIRLLRVSVDPLEPCVAGRAIRHRASLRPMTRFIDGSEFDQSSQLRDVSVISGGPVAVYVVDGALLITTRESALVMGPTCPPLLLADLLENWLLWGARERGQVMVHAAGWLRDGKIEMFVGSSGDGKTTELFRQVQAGAQYFANDRVALRLEGDVLLGRSFPEPLNIGTGTIRALGMDLPTFAMSDTCALRLLPADVAARWNPDFFGWYPVNKIVSPSRATYEKNVYWDGDPDHPFWNHALRPRELIERQTLERAMDARLTIIEAERAGGATSPSQHRAGTVKAIVIGRRKGEPLIEIDSARAYAGRGLEGDRYLRGKPYGDASRDLTLIDAEALTTLRQECGIVLEPTQARRNVVTEGIDLEALVGRRFALGTVQCIGIKLCPPCVRLEHMTVPGVLRGLAGSGGLRAAIVSDGYIHVGAPITVLP